MATAAGQQAGQAEAGEQHRPILWFGDTPGETGQIADLGGAIKGHGRNQHRAGAAGAGTAVVPDKQEVGAAGEQGFTGNPLTIDAVDDAGAAHQDFIGAELGCIQRDEAAAAIEMQLHTRCAVRIVAIADRWIAVGWVELQESAPLPIVEIGGPIVGAAGKGGGQAEEIAAGIGADGPCRCIGGGRTTKPHTARVGSRHGV